jgi:uncharacterized protein with PIN domain
VGVPCAGCGRDYDVTLFAFGRTIHCTCGRRVGLEPRVRKGIAGGELRFIADAMLGRLARWLRILGFDTAYEAHISDGELVRRAIEEQRVVLTRDRTLPEEWRVSGIFVMATDEPLEQLGEVGRAFGLERHVRIFTRCNRCNARLVAATRGEVRERVPARILRTEEQFLRCPGCERVYWSGSHTRRMRRVVEQVLNPGRADQDPAQKCGFQATSQRKPSGSEK